MCKVADMYRKLLFTGIHKYLENWGRYFDNHTYNISEPSNILQ